MVMQLTHPMATAPRWDFAPLLYVLNQNVCVCVCVCMYVCVFMSVCLCICLSVCLSVCLTVCLSVCLSVSLSPSLSLCLCLCLSLSLCICVWVCVHMCMFAHVQAYMHMCVKRERETERERVMIQLYEGRNGFVGSMSSFHISCMFCISFLPCWGFFSPTHWPVSDTAGSSPAIKSLEINSDSTLLSVVFFVFLSSLVLCFHCVAFLQLIGRPV